MLTDIFAFRYIRRPIWSAYTETERRLLNQAFAIVQDAIPYWTSDNKEDPKRKEVWKRLHDQIARELGIDELSKRYYSYTQKNALGAQFPVSGTYTYDHVCGTFVKEPYTGQYDADKFIKDRLSFVELALRVRGEEVAAANAELPRTLADAEIRDKLVQSRPRVPGSLVDGVRAWNERINATYRAQVEELNERFRRAEAPITYHNGFIQLELDPRIEEQIARPFWEAVAHPMWQNVDIDIKEALDQRDSKGKDPALYAAKALESAIKIISGHKRWTRGTETGAAHYIDNLVSKANGSFIAAWESDILKDYFRKVRNTLGHGPGSEPMPVLSLEQTDWAIETAMSWIRSLIRRL